MRKLKLKIFFNKQSLKYLFFSLLFSILQVVCLIAIPVLLPYLNSLAKGQSGNPQGIFGTIDFNIQVVILVLILIALASVLLISSLICNKFSVKFARSIAINMRTIAYKNIQIFTIVDIEKFGQSSLINRLVIDINNVATALESLARLMFKAIIIYLGGIVGLIIVVFTTPTANNIDLMINANIPKYSILLVVIGISVFLVAIIFLISYFAQNKFMKVQKELDTINDIAQENVLGQKAVKSFVLQNQQFQTFKDSNNELYINASKAGYIIAAILPTIYFLLDTSMLFIVWLSNKNTLDIVVSMFLLISLIITALIISIVSIIQISRALPSYFRVLEIATYKVSIEYPTKECKLSSKKTISIKNLNFSYPNCTTNALSDINLEINDNDVIGIIGPTGSGKSTLISMIMRLYDPTTGTVKLCDNNVKKLTKHQLKSNISYCPQNVVLFEGTIKSNISFGNEFANDKDIELASKAACLYDFIISKPDKFDSKVEQRGKNLSGGQKQRLALARTLVKKSKFLILDDSTSALDMITESKICNLLIKNKNKQTVIIASQRITAIKDMKKIIVMENGKIIGFGTHNELLKTCPYYYDVAIAQLGELVVKNEIY